MESAEVVKPKRKFRFLKLFLKIFGIGILVLVLFGIAIGMFFGNDIKQYVVKQINKQLAVEVKVSGDIDFSVLRNFPYASVTFNAVEIRESYTGSKSNLLETEKISLLFNILDIWRGNYTLQKIIVGKGKLNIMINKKGEGNYFIFKNDSSSSDSSLAVNIDKIEFSDLQTRFLDDADQQLYVFNIHDGTLSGKFGSELLKLNLNASLLCEHLYVSDDDYLRNKEVSLKTDLNIDLKSNEYSFADLDASVENFAFTSAGKVKQKKNSTYMDLTFAGKQIGIESFAGILPEQYSKYLKEYSSSGNLLLNGRIKGDYSSKKNPDVSFSFEVKGATISNSNIDSKIERVNFSALYTNGSGRKLSTSQLAVKNAVAYINGKQVDFGLQLRNFISPYIDVQLNTVLNLAEIYPLFKLEELKDCSGDLHLNKCFYSGPVSQLTSSPDFKLIKSGGEIILSNGKINYNGTELTGVNASFSLSNGDLRVIQLNGKTVNSDVQISGTCTNLLPYVFNISNNKNSSFKIGIDLTANASTLDVNDFNNEVTSSSKTESGSNAVAGLLEMISGSVKFNIGQFNNDRFNANNFRGTLVCKDNSVFFNNISLNAEKGKATINAQMNFADWNHVTLDGTFACTSVDITQLFYEFNNWDQQEITDKNLKGTLSSNFVLKAAWKEKEFDYSKLMIVADVTVDKGELNNFEPMKALSSFIKISELENIRFSQLKNQIEIRNSTVFIPTMNIFTNALNLELSGSHTFNNMIDYKIKLNLLQLLSNKFKSKNNFDPDAVEQSTDGLMNLYITMTGPASDPVIKYDKKSVKEKIKQDVQTEKQNLQTILQQEFNKQEQQQDEIKDWKAPDHYEELQFDSTTLQEIDFGSDTGEEEPTSITKQKQQKAFEDFKNSLKKKPK